MLIAAQDTGLGIEIFPETLRWSLNEMLRDGRWESGIKLKDMCATFILANHGIKLHNYKDV